MNSKIIVLFFTVILLSQSITMGNAFAQTQVNALAKGGILLNDNVCNDETFEMNIHWKLENYYDNSGFKIEYSATHTSGLVLIETASFDPINSNGHTDTFITDVRGQWTFEIISVENAFKYSAFPINYDGMDSKIYITIPPCDNPLEFVENNPNNIALNSEIPSWIKQAGDFWVKGQTTDREFASSIAYLVRSDIIPVSGMDVDPNGDIVIDENMQLPDWIKNTITWWVSGAISDSEFQSGVKFLLEEKIIDFKEKKTTPSKVSLSNLSDEHKKLVFESGARSVIANEYAVETILEMYNYKYLVTDNLTDDIWQDYSSSKRIDLMEHVQELEEELIHLDKYRNGLVLSLSESRQNTDGFFEIVKENGFDDFTLRNDATEAVDSFSYKNNIRTEQDYETASESVEDAERLLKSELQRISIVGGTIPVGTGFLGGMCTESFDFVDQNLTLLTSEFIFDTLTCNAWWIWGMQNLNDRGFVEYDFNPEPETFGRIVSEDIPVIDDPDPDESIMDEGISILANPGVSSNAVFNGEPCVDHLGTISLEYEFSDTSSTWPDEIKILVIGGAFGGSYVTMTPTYGGFFQTVLQNIEFGEEYTIRIIEVGHLNDQDIVNSPYDHPSSELTLVTPYCVIEPPVEEPPEDPQEDPDPDESIMDDLAPIVSVGLAQVTSKNAFVFDECVSDNTSTSSVTTWIFSNPEYFNQFEDVKAKISVSRDGIILSTPEIHQYDIDGKFVLSDQVAHGNYLFTIDSFLVFDSSTGSYVEVPLDGIQTEISLTVPECEVDIGAYTLSVSEKWIDEPTYLNGNIAGAWANWQFEYVDGVKPMRMFVVISIDNGLPQGSPEWPSNDGLLKIFLTSGMSVEIIDYGEEGVYVGNGDRLTFNP